MTPNIQEKQTTIRISGIARELLKHIGNKGQTYDSIILDLIEYWNKTVPDPFEKHRDGGN